MNNKFRTIFIDLDGVLCNFAGYYQHLFNKSIDIVNLNGSSDKEMWNNIIKYGKTKFFEELPWLPGSKIMWDFIVNNFVKVKILSACGRKGVLDTDISKGKHSWLTHHLPKLRYEDIILVEDKHKKQYYSKKGDIIIDDTPIVIEEWNAKGGIGIHFKSAEKTMEELKGYVYE